MGKKYEKITKSLKRSSI